MRALIYLLFLSTSVFAQNKTPKSETEIVYPNRDLVIVDGKVVHYTSLKDYFEEIKNVEIESMSMLGYPLYIINGLEYSEDQLFGPRPTSPYYPLVEQEITSINIIRGKSAIKLYGQMKGQSGVVVIETKNGKPLKK